MYFRGHAQSTYMSDGRTFEEAVNERNAEIENNKSQISSVNKSLGDLSAKVAEMSEELEHTSDVALSHGPTLDRHTVELAELSAELESNGQLIEDLQNMKIDKEADDYYPQLSVGTADNLAGVDEVDSEFNFRRSGGGAITDGVARVQSIKGNSVVYNQMIASLTIPVGEYAYGSAILGLSLTKGQFYALILNNGELVARLRLVGTSYVSAAATQQVILYNGDTTTDGHIQISGTSTKETHVSLINLTKMFGSGNEPTTIGEFYSRIPIGVDLNAYNEGEVINMSASGIKSVGRNIWDEEWESGAIANATGEDAKDSSRIRSKNYIPIFPSTNYYCYYGEDAGANHIYAFFYDKDKNFISGGARISGKVFTSPSNAHYLRFSNYGTTLTTYNHDICINLSDASFNGQYEAYREATEDLSLVAKYFPQGMRSAGSAHDEIRYNKQSNRWEKVVRIGEVDMGTLSWYREFMVDRYLFYASLEDIKPTDISTFTSNILQTRYPFDSSYGTTTQEDKTIRRYGRFIYIRDDAYTDAAAFKAAMAGVMLYYELAEPIVTEIEEKDFNLDYSVWNCGTEAAIAEGKSSALSADITYGFNAVGLLKQIKAALQAAGIMV